MHTHAHARIVVMWHATILLGGKRNSKSFSSNNFSSSRYSKIQQLQQQQFHQQQQQFQQFQQLLNQVIGAEQRDCYWCRCWRLWIAGGNIWNFIKYEIMILKSDVSIIIVIIRLHNASSYINHASSYVIMHRHTSSLSFMLHHYDSSYIFMHHQSSSCVVCIPVRIWLLWWSNPFQWSQLWEGMPHKAWMEEADWIWLPSI